MLKDHNHLLKLQTFHLYISTEMINNLLLHVMLHYTNDCSVPRLERGARGKEVRITFLSYVGETVPNETKIASRDLRKKGGGPHAR